MEHQGDGENWENDAGKNELIRDRNVSAVAACLNGDTGYGRNSTLQKHDQGHRISRTRKDRHQNKGQREHDILYHDKLRTFSIKSHFPGHARFIGETMSSDKQVSVVIPEK
jgi:hypothetical protein